MIAGIRQGSPSAHTLAPPPLPWTPASVSAQQHAASLTCITGLLVTGNVNTSYRQMISAYAKCRMTHCACSMACKLICGARCRKRGDCSFGWAVQQTGQHSLQGDLTMCPCAANRPLAQKGATPVMLASICPSDR